ncbi:hypothetical protein GWI33_015999 [Rhynchophorus ferrugineus]|uniref:Transmembrane protein n=1 Tax=Rhynchophorus ferrugineus TaxID=354439 RepID=A0A834M5D1_RHYFE|nr:hypothetical protein GWI33_015999 [Rhynchophorus ferrugineus]
MPDQETQYEQPEWDQFVQTFCQVASLQGRLAYCLMSVHAVNPAILQIFTDYDIYNILFWNMIYGITVMITARPALRPLMPLHRLTFGILASLSFNHSTLLWYRWLSHRFENNIMLLTFLGYLSGRIMIVHLLAFLYHIDTRCNDTLRPRRDPAFESMYM